MNYQEYSIMVAIGFNVIAATIYGSIDAFYIKRDYEIKMDYKISRMVIAMLVNLGFCTIMFYRYGISLLYGAGLWLVCQAAAYIVFEVVLNVSRNKDWHYISDDGLNHNTSPDDKIFHYIAIFLFKNEGSKVSGYMKFIFKLALMYAGVKMMVV